MCRTLSMFLKDQSLDSIVKEKAFVQLMDTVHLKAQACRNIPWISHHYILILLHICLIFIKMTKVK